MKRSKFSTLFFSGSMPQNTGSLLDKTFSKIINMLLILAVTTALTVAILPTSFLLAMTQYVWLYVAVFSAEVLLTFLAQDNPKEAIYRNILSGLIGFFCVAPLTSYVLTLPSGALLISFALILTATLTLATFAVMKNISENQTAKGKFNQLLSNYGFSLINSLLIISLVVLFFSFIAPLTPIAYFIYTAVSVELSVLLLALRAYTILFFNAKGTGNDDFEEQLSTHAAIGIFLDVVNFALLMGEAHNHQSNKTNNQASKFPAELLFGIILLPFLTIAAIWYMCSYKTEDYSTPNLRKTAPSSFSFNDRGFSQYNQGWGNNSFYNYNDNDNQYFNRS